MLVVEWFMCVYTRTLPWASALRVLDMFFCEGTSAVLNFYGIGFFYEKPPAMPRPPPLKTRMARWRENVLGKIQPSERCYEVAFVFKCAARLCALNLPLVA